MMTLGLKLCTSFGSVLRPKIMVSKVFYSPPRNNIPWMPRNSHVNLPKKSSFPVPKRSLDDIASFIRLCVKADTPISTRSFGENDKNCFLPYTTSIIVEVESARERRAIAADIKAHFKGRGMPVLLDGHRQSLKSPSVGGSTNTNSLFNDANGDDGWIVVDLGDTWVHLMAREARLRYALEERFIIKDENDDSKKEWKRLEEALARGPPRKSHKDMAFLDDHFIGERFSQH